MRKRAAPHARVSANSISRNPLTSVLKGRPARRHADWLLRFVVACFLLLSFVAKAGDIAALEQQFGGPAGLLDFLSTRSEDEVRATLSQHGMGYVVHPPDDALESLDEFVSVEALPEGFWEGCPKFYADEHRDKLHAVDGKYYYIDAYGRPRSAYAYLPPIMSARRRPLCQSATNKWGKEGDPANFYDGGHLIGAQLGGWGYRANLVPQQRGFNRGNWAQLENAMVRCGSLGSERMMYRVSVSYPEDPDQVIPSTFQLYMEDRTEGDSIALNFDNAPAGGPNGTITRYVGVEFLERNGCNGNPPNLDTPRDPGVLRIMAIGDSITHGNVGAFTWRYRLHEHLRGAGVKVDFVGPYDRANNGYYAKAGWDFAHASFWGQTAMEAWSVVAEDVEIYDPDILLIHLGTNDLTFLNGTPDTVAGDIARMIDEAREVNGDVDIVLAQIGDTAGLTDAETVAYNEALANLARNASTPASRVVVANVAGIWDWATDTYDRTHPNERGEHVIAKAFADSLSANFGIGRPYPAIPRLSLKPGGVALTPSVIQPTTPLTVSWNRVVNPGVWTTYKVQIRNHRNYGFGLVWESPETPNTSVAYNGRPLGLGVYHVVVLSLDGTHATMSDEVPLEVRAKVGPPPPAPTVTPGAVLPNTPFFVTWPRVVNPGVWTTYKVQVRQHRDFGFALVWESPETPNLAVVYNGPALRLGVYHIVVVAHGGAYETPSEPIPLEVSSYVGPPKPVGVAVAPRAVTPDMTFFVTWPRVVNPGVWTTYKVQVRNHFNFGFGLVWESAPTQDLAIGYTGPRLGLGTYHIVVVALDGVHEAMSEPVPLEVRSILGPPAPTLVQVNPDIIAPTTGEPSQRPFSVSWERVVNPGVWTTYKVQVRNHRDFGFALKWESPATPDTSLDYTGPRLGVGAYHVVVVATDGTHERMSPPELLEVRQPGGPFVRVFSERNGHGSHRDLSIHVTLGDFKQNQYSHYHLNSSLIMNDTISSIENHSDEWVVFDLHHIGQAVPFFHETICFPPRRRFSQISRLDVLGCFKPGGATCTNHFEVTNKSYDDQFSAYRESFAGSFDDAKAKCYSVVHGGTPLW